MNACGSGQRIKAKRSLGYDFFQDRAKSTESDDIHLKKIWKRCGHESATACDTCKSYGYWLVINITHVGDQHGCDEVAAITPIDNLSEKTTQ